MKNKKDVHNYCFLNLIKVWWRQMTHWKIFIKRTEYNSQDKARKYLLSNSHSKLKHTILIAIPLFNSELITIIACRKWLAKEIIHLSCERLESSGAPTSNERACKVLPTTLHFINLVCMCLSASLGEQVNYIIPARRPQKSCKLNFACAFNRLHDDSISRSTMAKAICQQNAREEVKRRDQIIAV